VRAIDRRRDWSAQIDYAREASSCHLSIMEC
jgi:hypothetical protein